MNAIVYVLIQIFLVLLLAPLVNTIVRKVKAFTQKRKGPPLLQMYYDLRKLFHKSAVVSDTTSWVFKAAPYVVFSTALIAALFVPVSTSIAPVAFVGDIILIIYLLALGRFFMALAGLDAASTFGGMGSSREMMIASLIEPSMLITVITVGLISKSTSVHQMMLTSNAIGSPLASPVYMVLFLALLVIIIAETCRIPIDDPATHLELTMVHEAMLLEYSGRHLALMELGAAIKQLLFITILVNIFMPHEQLIGAVGIAAIILSILIYLLKVVFVSVLIAIVEASTVKLRLLSVPNLAALSFILSFLGFLNYLVLWR
jgi:formate hydrogenlyase subunit 4